MSERLHLHTVESGQVRFRLNSGNHLVVWVLPVNVLAVLYHLQQLLLTGVLHHHHGADSKDVCKAEIDDAVCGEVISTCRENTSVAKYAFNTNR